MNTEIDEVGAETERLKTQVMFIDTSKQRLYDLSSWNQVSEAAKKMKHGEIVAMVNFCQSKGVIPPRKFIFWQRFNAGGQCCICGTSVGTRWPGPIYAGVKELNAGGYCNDCGEKVHKANLWKAAEAIRWKKILQHRIQRKTWYRLILWNLLWFIPFGQEEFIDPDFKIVYSRADRNSTRDDGPLSDAENIKHLALMIYHYADDMIGGK